MKSLLYILTCSILGILIVLLMYSQSIKSVPKNDFQRVLLSDGQVEMNQVLKVKNNIHYLAGLTNNQIYLGNYVELDQVETTDYTLKKLNPININAPESKLNISDNQKYRLKIFRVTLDSPDLYISDKINSKIFYRSICESKFSQIDLNDIGIGFSKFVPINDTSYITRSYDRVLNQNVLMKIVKTSELRKDASFTLERQVDGLFCTDGSLLYNEYLKQAIYIYRYRNQFVGFDVDLNVRYRAKTIDTISYANIRTHMVSSQNRIVLTSNPPEVNIHCTTHRNFLYIHSGIVADNEEKKVFEENSAIDVYDLKQQLYIFSFYIPHYKGEKMTEFMVYENNVVVLYNQYLIVFKLNSSIISKRSQLLSLNAL